VYVNGFLKLKTVQTAHGGHLGSLLGDAAALTTGDATVVDFAGDALPTGGHFFAGLDAGDGAAAP